MAEHVVEVRFSILGVAAEGSGSASFEWDQSLSNEENMKSLTRAFGLAGFAAGQSLNGKIDPKQL